MSAADETYSRTIAIGDLNGALDVLRDILRGTGVIDEHDRWIGGRTHVIQTGDIFDRGGGQACACLRLLRDLAEPARSDGGRVTVLLGNHEVMAALGDQRWRTADEYLAFASDDERADWRRSIRQAEREFLARYPSLPRDAVRALIESRKSASAPGRHALERALRPDGEIGAVLRQLPVAVVSGDAVFCHGGLTPDWARLGIDGLAASARDAWLDPHAAGNIFQDERGPLWNRQLTLGDAARAGEQLQHSLALFGVSRMVVGHTPSAHVEGGQARRIATRLESRLVCIDVGLPPGQPGIALIIDERGGHEWCRSGERMLWRR